MRRVVSIVGARPQFVKLAPIYRAFLKYKRSIRHIILHTGQHYDFLMSDIFFKDLGIRCPDINLGVGSSEPHIQIGEMIKGIGSELSKMRPDLVLIYGDTNSTLAGAITSSKIGIPFAHIEAGLRSYIRDMPEEINRIVADRLADILFCPSYEAVKNLRQEGIDRLIREKSDLQRFSPPYVIVCGDLMYDVLIYARKTYGRMDGQILKKYNIEKGKYALATVHRAENTDCLKNLKNILYTLNVIGKEIKVVLPLHPRTREVIRREGLFDRFKNVRIIEPLGYLEMLAVESHSRVILTDSGGVQKEAFWLSVPCITLREKTEWIETVKCGFNILAGSNPDTIISAYKKQINFRSRMVNKDIYGDGKSSNSIVEWIRGFLK